MTVAELINSLSRFDGTEEVKLTFAHQTSRVIPGSVDLYESKSEPLIIDCVRMDGCVEIHGGDC